MAKTPFYRQYLKTTLADRIQKNSRYSLRAFANQIGVSGGALSQIMSGKRVPSFRTAQRLISALEAPPEERSLFFSSIAAVHNKRGLMRMSPYFRSPREIVAPKPLDMDVFRVLSNWYYVSILELTFVHNFRSDPAWIAKQLQISVVEAELAIEKMLELNLLVREGEQLKKADRFLITDKRELTSAALKRLQEQFMEKSRASLLSDPIELRSNTSMTMAIDPSLIPLAKKQIEEFAQQLCALLEASERKRVYNLNINLNPIQKGEA